jgi:hypothetical protein
VRRATHSSLESHRIPAIVRSECQILRAVDFLDLTLLPEAEFYRQSFTALWPNDRFGGFLGAFSEARIFALT